MVNIELICDCIDCFAYGGYDVRLQQKTLLYQRIGSFIEKGGISISMESTLENLSKLIKKL